MCNSTKKDASRVVFHLSIIVPSPSPSVCPKRRNGFPGSKTGRGPYYVSKPCDGSKVPVGIPITAEGEGEGVGDEADYYDPDSDDCSGSESPPSAGTSASDPVPLACPCPYPTMGMFPAGPCVAAAAVLGFSGRVLVLAVGNCSWSETNMMKTSPSRHDPCAQRAQLLFVPTHDLFSPYENCLCEASCFFALASCLDLFPCFFRSSAALDPPPNDGGGRAYDYASSLVWELGNCALPWLVCEGFAYPFACAAGTGACTLDLVVGFISSLVLPTLGV
ncbi:hypothetical protein BGY98DRAFT_938271 [Russula aff. rugulosa BPL654]|nr:hypothetical protein BGY98DRAFT_938271 [Russula aff. rugulosa BPL654]